MYTGFQSQYSTGLVRLSAACGIPGLPGFRPSKKGPGTSGSVRTSRWRAGNVPTSTDGTEIGIFAIFVRAGGDLD